MRMISAYSGRQCAGYCKSSMRFSRIGNRRSILRFPILKCGIMRVRVAWRFVERLRLRVICWTITLAIANPHGPTALQRRRRRPGATLGIILRLRFSLERMFPGSRTRGRSWPVRSIVCIFMASIEGRSFVSTVGIALPRSPCRWLFITRITIRCWSRTLAGPCHTS